MDFVWIQNQELLKKKKKVWFGLKKKPKERIFQVDDLPQVPRKTSNEPWQETKQDN